MDSKNIEQLELLTNFSQFILQSDLKCLLMALRYRNKFFTENEI